MSATMQGYPSDILAKIFAILSADGYTIGNNSAAPWNLARVSRHWRQTALSYSSLWANIKLPISRPTALSRCHHVALALERSGKHPLTFVIYSPLPSSESAPLTYIIPALIALSKETRRWKSAKFCMPTDITAVFLAVLGGPFDCLEEIWLEKSERESKYQCDFSERGLGVELSTLFLDAPKLVEMKCHFDIPFQLPRAQLKTFTFHFTSNSMIPYITAIPWHLCPQLKDLKVQQWTNDERTQGTITLPVGRSVLPHLEVAHIDRVDPLLDLMIAPALKNITVQWSSTQDDRIIPLIERSQCYDLEILVAMQRAPIDVIHLIEQPKFTKLRHLALAGPVYDLLAIFSALRDRSSLPALDNISVIGLGVPHVDEHYVECFALLKMILEVVQTRELKAMSVAVADADCGMRYAMEPVDRRLDTSDCLAKLEDQVKNRGVDLSIVLCGQNFIGLLHDVPGMDNFLH